MKESAPLDEAKRNRLTWILSGVFLFALIMGPGPGLYLINDYAAGGGTFLAMPALYAWAVFWFGVEALVILTAYTKLWKDKSE